VLYGWLQSDMEAEERIAPKAAFRLHEIRRDVEAFIQRTRARNDLDTARVLVYDMAR